MAVGGSDKRRAADPAGGQRRVFAARRRLSGFTLVEVVLTVLIVGVGLVATMRTLPIITKTSTATRDLLVQQQLATDLLTEISLCPFEDPVSPVFGPEAGEGTTNRSAFEDIDDYNGWSASPPQMKSGAVYSNTTGFTQTVAVESVDPSDFTAVKSPGTTDAKRITVTIRRAGAAPFVLTTVRLRGANRED